MTAVFWPKMHLEREVKKLLRVQLVCMLQKYQQMTHLRLRLFNFLTAKL